MEKKIIIDGIETNYTISEEGVVFNTKTNKELKGTIARNEYRTVQFTINGKARSLMVHRLVAEAFLENDNPNSKTVVHHIDGNKHNNNINNLQWVTLSENAKHRFEKKTNEDILNNEDTNIDGFVNIENFSNYLINKQGQVYSKKSKRILKASERNGYKRVFIIDDNDNKKYISIHIAVYETFVGEIPKGMVIDHIDGNRSNNNIENLRCITQSENMRNAQKHGHKGQHKVAQYDTKGNFIKEFSSFTEAAKEFGVSYAAISSAAKRGGTSCGYKWIEIK